MEASNLRSEIHIAHQSRRERLRIQQQLNHQDQNAEVYTNNSLEHDTIQFQRIRYGDLAYNPIIFSSEMENFHLVQQESLTSQSDRLLYDNIKGDPQNFRTWKSIGPNNTRDGATGRMEVNKNTSLIIGGLSDSLKTNPSSSAYDYQYATSSLDGHSSEVSTRIGQKRYGYVGFTCPSVYQNVTYTSDMSPFPQEHTREPCHVSWPNNSNAFGTMPSYKEIGGNENPNTQGLVLSLSSVPLDKQNQCQTHERSVPMELNSGDTYVGSVNPEAKDLMSEYRKLCSKPFMIGNSTSFQRGIVGPLGPFTGYATILKTSKFLRPAQQLLHEFCKCGGLENAEVSMKDSHESRSFGEDMDSLGGSSSSSLGRAHENVQEAAGSSGRHDACRPEFLQKKAKLLYMQEEVFRGYKHYHQQMQMVVSSFETVVGLSAATPYISVALKTVSRLFRSIRNAISDNLKNVRKALREDLSSLTADNASSSKNHTSSSRHRSTDPPEYPKKKASVSNLGLFEYQQHLWRPQRSLSDRAVAILRAWLFDHFLHPYPTDSDKLMLASQTGLTRNQVSNWFINARVRIWKPMVEEIHSLETKETAEPCTNTAKNDGKTATDDGSCSNARPFNTIPASGLSGKQVEYPGIGASEFPGNPTSAQAWNQNSTSMNFVSYHHGGIDLGGLEAVSLTLGLRQNVGGGAPPRRRLSEQPGNQIRTHFGDQIVYDFVG